MSTATTKTNLLSKFTRIDLFTLVLSIVTGLLVWFYVDSRRTEEKPVRAQLEISIPSGWKIIGKPSRSVEIILRGPRQIMGSLKPDEIRFVRTIATPEQSSSQHEVQLELKPEDIRGLPRDVTVVRILHPEIVINLSRSIRKYLPVKVDFSGKTPEGYSMKRYSYSPKYVAVYAPENEFLPNLTLATDPVNLDGRKSSFGAYVDLQPKKLKQTTIYPDEPVFVQIEMSEKSERKTLEKIPVSLLLATPMAKLGGGKLIPSQVSVTIQGGAETIKSLTTGAITVYIDTRDMGSSVQGEYVLPCHTLGIKGIEVLSVTPSEVRWVIPKVDKQPTNGKDTTRPISSNNLRGGN